MTYNALHNSGIIEVVCGPMFSGKTEELIRRVKRAQIAKQRVQLTLRNDGTYDFVNYRQNLGKKDSSIVQLRFK